MRLPNQERTPREFFQIPILEALDSKGGSARTMDVYAYIWDLMSDRFTERDLKEIPLRSPASQITEPIWKNQTRQAAANMRKHGLLEKSAKKLVWMISTKGRIALAESRRTPIASDNNEPEAPNRVQQTSYRILRDTDLARKIKRTYDHTCQICGGTIELWDGTNTQKPIT